MVKAVFFDWFNTLARYEPPREELQSQALQEFGIHASAQQIIPGILAADREFFEENAVSPIRKRNPEEQTKIYLHYQNTMLTEAGINVPEDISIMGFDNNMMADFVRPSLSTIAQSTEKIGAVAVSLVIGLIRNPSHVHEDIVVPVTVVDRESVKDLN